MLSASEHGVASLQMRVRDKQRAHNRLKLQLQQGDRLLAHLVCHP
jgi:hypothetical protein